MIKIQRILDKYEIIEQFSSDEFRARDLHKNYFIKRVRKEGLDEAMHSYLAQNLQDFRHKNLINIGIDEDDEFFYAIREDFEREEYRPLSPEIFKNSDEVDYAHLLECYLQIFDAISYIHSKGLYHGNISTNKILVTRDNRVFLLDFGKSYFYALLGDDEPHFKAPEQLGEIKADIDIRADIFSFGLCMLNLLLGTFEDFEFNKNYKKPSDLENIYAKIQNGYDLESSENEIFLLIRKMTALNPQDRISLDDLGKELSEIYDKLYEQKCYEIKCKDTTVERYCDNNDIDTDEDDWEKEFMKHIQSRIDNHKAYIREYFNEDKGELQLEIAINDLIFICSTKDNDDNFLFASQIREGELIRIEKIQDEGIELRDFFGITTRGYIYERANFAEIYTLKKSLKQKFKDAQLRNKRLETDRKAIATEEELLRAEKETIDLKKNVILARLKSVNKGKDTITFERIEIDKCSQKDREKFTEILKTAQNNQFTKTKKGKKSIDLTKVRDFQSADKVIIQSAEPDLSVELKGEVSSLNPAKKEIIVQFDKYKDVNKNTLQNAILTIAYDYQIEEILWSKKDKALSELKTATTKIPNLLRKINEPKELRENVLVEIPSFFDENLDENQQEAVIKALSLDNDSEILLIQGPPGTGKTTTITEMIRQIQKRHRHAKILVASQSNQAVDNVLEKICINEDKILRIGNDESKMSDIAKQFIPNKVLDKLIKDNRARIKANPISDENPNIDTKLKELQSDFDKALQTITAKIANKSTQNSKSPKEDELSALFLKNIRVIFGTLLGISSWKDFRSIVFDFAIVDEAGRATLSELCVPCSKLGISC